MSEFSVIIPTLQRAKELHELVEQCAAHPRVLEVLVINNAPEPLAWESPKVRVLQQAENIYVNPAWNLGAREARGKYLAILNDDISFAPALFDRVAWALRLPGVGIVGASFRCFTEASGHRLRLRPARHRPDAFGTAMFMRAERYIPIPDALLIYYGDDWLFQAQTRLNMKITDFTVRTPGSVTSKDRSFDGVKGQDRAWAEEHDMFNGPYARRLASFPFGR